MRAEANGELIPAGGGDNIPLIRNKLTIGRRESCDICLRFPNISGIHCELSFQDGYWYIRDLGSTNGIKVNGERVGRKPLSAGDEICIASRRFVINYIPAGQSSLDEIMEEEDAEDIMNQPLLEKAGLLRPRPEHLRNPPKHLKPRPEQLRKPPPGKPRQYLLPGEEEAPEHD
jgi:adenylate cyclase